jgi:cytochrome oxidase assembly protein ShyY1
LAAFTSLAALTAGLGTWQMQRRQWKIDLIEQYQARFDSDPIPLSQSVFYSGADPEQELRRVALPDDAVFLHDKSYLLGPRVSPKQDASHTTGAMPSTGIGYFVITPLKCADGKVVLVNRGWIPKPGKGESPSIDKLEVPKGGIAVARNGEQMSSYLATGYDQRSNTFLAMDLPMMLNKMELLSAQTAASPSADMFLEMFGTISKIIFPNRFLQIG